MKHITYNADYRRNIIDKAIKPEIIEVKQSTHSRMLPVIKNKNTQYYKVSIF